MWIDKANEVLSYVQSRVGKNEYTQSDRRTEVDKGFSDCSSLVWWAYDKIGYNIGDYTGAQVVSDEMIDIDAQISRGVPNVTLMVPGDLIFFKRPGSSYPKKVGHVEMYVGDGVHCVGHGSGIGPTLKNLKNYCKNRYKDGKGVICVRRLKDIYYGAQIDGFYQNILNRNPSGDEANVWLRLANMGMPISEIRNGFIYSEENHRIIANMYEKYLKRQAKQEEIDFWKNQEVKGNIYKSTLGGIVYSEENKRRIKGLYEKYLGRTPREDEVVFWCNWEYDNDNPDVEGGILGSPEYNRIHSNA